LPIGPGFNCLLPATLASQPISPPIKNRQSKMLLAGTTRLELANQLIEGQPAFHFAFIPGKFLNLDF